jgi:enoyl-CoA hydratase/carnithine racemase
MSELVTYDSLKSRVAVITMNRPQKLNAINAQMARDLTTAWRRFEASEDRVAVLTGAGGKAFTAGADLRDPPTDGFGWMPALGAWSPGLGVPQVSKPVMCAVSGFCIGAGLVLVQYADLCVASEDAVFQYPEGHLGVCAGFETSLAVRIPHKVAMEILLYGQRMSAEKMLHYGFINRATPADQVLGTAIEMAAVVAECDPGLTSYLKTCVERTLPSSPGEIAAGTQWRAGQVIGNQRGLTAIAAEILD